MPYRQIAESHSSVLSFKGIAGFLLLSAIFFALCSGMQTVSVLKISSASVVPTEGDQTPRDIQLPYAAREADSSRLGDFTMRIDYHGWQSGRLQIVPDDCVREIKVNGQKVDISAIPQQFLCSWSNGFRVNLSPYLHSGSNTLSLRIENLGGGWGIDVRPLPWVLDGPGFILLYMFLLTGWMFFRVLRDRRDLLVVSGIGLALMLCFSAGKYWGDFQYDLWPNTTAVEYAANNFALPQENGTALRLPPYYLVNGLVYRVTSSVLQPGVQSWRIVQYINMLPYGLFLLYGVLILKCFVPSQRLSLAAATAFMLWPGHLMHVSRIDSDIWFYMAGVGFTFHFLQWLAHPDRRQLIFSLLWLVLASATSVYALGITLAAALLLIRRDYRSLRPFLKPIMVVLLLSVAILSAMDAYMWARAAYTAPPIPAPALAKNISTQPVAAADFITFDYTQYMNNPYILLNEWQVSVNRLFVDYFLRSMSFGQFQWDGLAPGATLDFLLLAMWCYLLVSLFTRYVVRQESLDGVSDFTILLAACVVTLMFSKALFYADGFGRADARHLYMVVPYFLCAYAQLLYLQKQDNNRVYLLGLTLLLGYAFTAFVHICYQLF